MMTSLLIQLFSRVQLEKMYEMMGGDDLPSEAKDILNKLQNKLINRLDQLAGQFGQSFLERITDGNPVLLIQLDLTLSFQKGVKQLSTMLLELKQSSEEELQIESDLILSPLLGTLDESFELFSQSAEKTVLKRILKSLWKLLLQTIEKHVVLPAGK